MKVFLSSLLVSMCFFISAQNVMTPEILWKLNRLYGGSISNDGRYVLYNSKSYELKENKGNNDLYIYDLKKDKIKQITQTPFSEMEAQWGPDNNIYFMSGEKDGLQIWSVDFKGGNKKQLSNFQNIELEGFKLAPNGKAIVTLEAIKMKPTVQDKYPDLPLANARVETDLMYRHWDHYDDYNKRHLVIHEWSENEFKNNGTDILEGEAFDGIIPPFGGTEQFCFSNDSKTIVYTSKKLQGIKFAQSTNSELYSYNIQAKAATVLSTSPGYDNNPSYSPTGSKIAWLSMAKNGFESDKNNIIIKDLSTNTLINITADIDLTVHDYVWHPNGKIIYFISPNKGTKHIFEIDIESKKYNQITEGQHDYVSFDVAKEEIIAMRQSMVAPTDMYAIDLKKKNKVRQLTKANAENLKDIVMPTVEERWVETTDGKQMLVWLILPPNFDENKKYPTLLYCQGGPQSMVSQFFSYRWNFSTFASQDYIIVAPNRRGLPGFGQEWNDAISKDWGGQPMNDYLSAIDELSKEPFVDETKLGAIGASYGGYSVYYLAGIHENRFKTLVAHCGLFNLESWYGSTEELFFANWDIGGPYWIEKNKALFEKNSPHKMVDKWNTPIMIIHGAKDFRVPESEGMQAFQIAKIKGIKTKYLNFPNEGHWVNSPQNSVLWYREVIEWLNSDLK